MGSPSGTRLYPLPSNNFPSDLHLFALGILREFPRIDPLLLAKVYGRENLRKDWNEREDQSSLRRVIREYSFQDYCSCSQAHQPSSLDFCLSECSRQDSHPLSNGLYSAVSKSFI
jgi:hypothetical protein